MGVDYVGKEIVFFLILIKYFWKGLVYFLYWLWMNVVILYYFEELLGDVVMDFLLDNKVRLIINNIIMR